MRELFAVFDNEKNRGVRDCLITFADEIVIPFEDRLCLIRPLPQM